MKTLKRTFYMILGLGLTGCATNALQTIPNDFTLGDKVESVVIGRMVLDMGTLLGMKPIGFFDRLNKIELTVKNETAGTSYVIVCDEGGSDSNFYVALPPGQYRLSEWKKGNLLTLPNGRFEVGKGQVVYLGTLKFVRRQDTASFVLGAFQKGFFGDWQVENEYESAVKSFRERYPQINQEIVKSLFQLE